MNKIDNNTILDKYKEISKLNIEEIYTKYNTSSSGLSITVGKYFFIPTGEHPPWIYPVRGSNSLDLIISILFSSTTTAAFFKSNSLFTGTKNT